MTAVINLSNSHYGMQELRVLYQRYVLRGLVTAIALHGLVIASYWIVNYFSKEDEPTVRIRIIDDIFKLGPPPSITNTEVAPQVAVSVPVAKPMVGVPVPVPDAEVNPERTIPEQWNYPQPSIGDTKDGGNQGVIKIDEVDPNPEDFVVTEKLPVPVKQVAPEYPEIARRAGVEGTVWVKILVDKNGKAKKAIIMKSNAEIFNEAALAAAKQWVFTPAMMNNGPVAVWAAIPFRFKLNK